MKTFIKHISNIQTGLFAKPTGIGEVIYLQSKHFNDHGQLLSIPHPDLMAQHISDKHILRGGDVLFAAKGSKNFATVYEEHNAPAVASTSFFVLKLTNLHVLPEYLTWFLNSPPIQLILKGQAIGSSMPSISKQVLENLEIIIPSIQTQNTILEITKLRNREKSLKIDIETLREKQIQQQIFEAIN